jgi:hypothetical protein
MAVSSRAQDVRLADEFFADQKGLAGPAPEFGPKKHTSSKSSLWEAIWPTANSAGVVETGQLRINHSPASDKPFSLCLIFRGQCIFRLDFARPTVCHSNPQWAAAFGMPPTVCGPHYHPWDPNREEVARQEHLWELPFRLPLPARIRRFDQALPWMAAEVNLLLAPEQRGFGLPETLF